MLRPLLFAAVQAAPPSPSITVTTGTPSVTDLPGSSVLNTLTNGIEAWALIAAVVGIVIGAVIWAFGHYSQNYQQAYNGRRGVMVSGLAGILIGGAPYIVSWFDNHGAGFR
jgi:MFS family permease